MVIDMADREKARIVARMTYTLDGAIHIPHSIYSDNIATSPLPAPPTGQRRIPELPPAHLAGVA
jgi:hypothetical protein